MTRQQSIDRNRYKQFLLVLKYLPYVLMIIDIVNTFTQREPVVAYVGGVSFLGILFMWITSKLFMFCRHHRVPLCYLLLNNCLTLAHDYFSVNTQTLDHDLAIGGIVAMFLTYIYLKEKGYDFSTTDSEETFGDDN